MSWYDAFIPPEAKSAKALWTKGIQGGDWEGAGEDILASQSGHLGSYLKKADEGNDEIRQGYTDAIADLKKLGEEQKNFQMQGLDKAENYYLPAQQRLTALYGEPGMFRK